MSILRVSGVSHRFGKVSALRDISVAFGPGITGLVGPNGSGKTTLLCIAAGAGEPRRGQVTLGGVPVRARAVRNDIGVVLQTRTPCPSWHGRDLVTAAARLRGLAAWTDAGDRALERFELTSVADRAISTYSLGQRQRLQLAVATVHEPTALLLDEPFNGLDHDGQIVLARFLRTAADDGRVVVVSSHVLPDLDDLADSVVVVSGGRLVAAGRIDEIRPLVLAGQHRILLECSPARKLASTLAECTWLKSVEVLTEDEDDADVALVVTVGDVARFGEEIMGIARRHGIRLTRVVPLDSNLATLYATLMRRP